MSGREKPLILQNGMPIPQAFDVDLDDWTEYSTEHIKAIKAELALVKSELANIKANQLSGDQKVQLSGAIKQLAFVQDVTVTAGTSVTVIPIQNFGNQALRYRVFIRPKGMDRYEILEYAAREGTTLAIASPTILEAVKPSNAWSEVQTPITGTFGIRVVNKTDTDYSPELILIGYRG